jgi:sialate O-acetylesterase
VQVLDAEENVTEEVRFANVLFGEVWLAGGQSNMELELGNCKQGNEELAWIAQQAKERGSYDDIRFFFTVKAPYEDEEWTAKQAQMRWHSIAHESGHTVSAVAYFAAKRIQRQLQVPVGIINCNHGGTSISCWIQKEELLSFPEGKLYWQEYGELVGNKTDEMYLQEMEDYNQVLEAYNTAFARETKNAAKRGEELSAEQMEERIGAYPWPQPQGWLSPYRPAGLVETMLMKVVPYTVRGIWFYQGEEDSNRAVRYEVMLTRLIAHWRNLMQEELPFVIVQLPMFLEKGATDLGDWVSIRRAQAQVADTVSGVSLVSLCDLGEYNNIHPVDKRTPGTRLGVHTLDVVYGCAVNGRMMRYSGSFVEAGTLTVYFDDSCGGILINRAEQGLEPVLVTARQAQQEGIAIEGFEVAGADGRFYPADAYVEQEFILLTSREVPMPLTARYAWADYTRANVYSKAGMPLQPFAG